MAQQPDQRRGRGGVRGRGRCAGANRHEEGDGRALHRRGSAHDGPEPCAGARKDVSEALRRRTRRPAIEPRNHLVRGADVVDLGGRQHRGRRYARAASGPRAGLRTCACAESSCAGPGRPHNRPAARSAVGPPREGCRTSRTPGEERPSVARLAGGTLKEVMVQFSAPGEGLFNFRD